MSPSQTIKRMRSTFLLTASPPRLDPIPAPLAPFVTSSTHLRPLRFRNAVLLASAGALADRIAPKIETRAGGRGVITATIYVETRSTAKK